MNIAELNTLPSLDSCISEIERYGLSQNALELMTYGFTVVSPKNLGLDPTWIERFRDATVSAYERGKKVAVGDYRTSAITGDFTAAFYDEDEVFIEAALNPAKLALVRLVLGQRAVLRTNTIILKGPADQAPENDYFDYQKVPLHADNDTEQIAMGAGQICHRLNCMWLGTDQFDDADGPTLVVPASQHCGHSVWPHEADVTKTSYPTVSLKGEAGSIAMWQGGTFHAALPRARSGLRVTLSENYTRHYITAMAALADVYLSNVVRLSPEVSARYPGLERVIGRAEIEHGGSNPPFDPYM